MEKIVVNKTNQPKKEMKSYVNDFIKYVKQLYRSKYIIWKFIIFLVISLIVFTTSFVLRNNMLASTKQTYDLIPGFLTIYIIDNTGIAFSGLSNSSSSLVYFVQSLPIIFSVLFLLFTKSFSIDIGLSLVLTGGLSNIIDRSLFDSYAHLQINGLNAVVDYFQFSFIPNSAVFNFPDVSVIVGVIIVGITLVVQFIKEWIQESSNKKNKNNNSQSQDIKLTDKEKENIKKENANKIKLVLDKHQKSGTNNGKPKN